MKIALAQINTTVGAIEANCRRILDAYDRAAGMGAELVVFPELTLTGYPPKDLLELPAFVRRNVEALGGLAARMTGPGVVIGYVEPTALASGGQSLFNTAALIEDGRVVSRHRKSLLPTYDVFDEGRHFEPARKLVVAEFRGRRLGVTVCEDFWNNNIASPFPQRPYHTDPVRELVERGVDLLVNINASPFHVGKRGVRARMYGGVARRWGVPVVQVNLVGGNDNLIFDGASNAWDGEGRCVAQAARFREDLVLFDSDAASAVASPPPSDDACEEADLHAALTLGLRDYVAKCGFTRVVIGLSGGIDSAVTAALAVDALGPENVVGVSMPSRFSSAHSRDDARALAENFGIEYHTLEVEPIVEAFLAPLDPLFRGTQFGVAEENLQARARGTLLMTLSNKFGWLVLATGNKSELAVGYCTLYGDMNGGLAVLGDVLKTKVFALARWINRDAERIPNASLTKPPSAELRADQLDTDSLPPYDVLDPIVAGYVEERRAPEELVARGVDAMLVARITRMIDRTEYKRQQAALCLKVTPKAFGSGRRMPIARGQ